MGVAVGVNVAVAVGGGIGVSVGLTVKVRTGLAILVAVKVAVGTRAMPLGLIGLLPHAEKAHITIKMMMPAPPAVSPQRGTPFRAGLATAVGGSGTPLVAPVSALPISPARVNRLLGSLARALSTTRSTAWEI